MRVLASWAVILILAFKVQNSMPGLFRFATLYNYEKCQKSPWPIHVIMMFDDFRVTKSTLTNFTTWELASFKPCQVWSKVLLMNRMIPTLITKLLLRKIKEWRLQGIELIIESSWLKLWIIDFFFFSFQTSHFHASSLIIIIHFKYRYRVSQCTSGLT